MKLDNEESEILAAYDAGKLKLQEPTQKTRKKIVAMASNTFKKDKRITIRLYDRDLKGIQKKALILGVPYQTLISSMIHRYVEGDLVDRSGLSSL